MNERAELSCERESCVELRKKGRKAERYPQGVVTAMGKKDKKAASAAAAPAAASASASTANGARVGVDAPALFIGLDGPVSDKKSKCAAYERARTHAPPSLTRTGAGAGGTRRGAGSASTMPCAPSSPTCAGPSR